MSAEVLERVDQDLFSWSSPVLECNFGHGLVRYRVVKLAPRISESVFEYFNVRRGLWRVTRNTNSRRGLWEIAQREANAVTAASLAP
jgi:hypothetical protein